MRLRHVVVSISVCVFLAGCASVRDRGWSGEGATPFDTAQATCDAEAAPKPAGRDREAAFDACMARHGWTRPSAGP